MSYTPEQIERRANHFEKAGILDIAAMLRAYAATLRQSADSGRVGDGILEKWPNGSPKWGYIKIPNIGKALVEREEAEQRISEAALAAQGQPKTLGDFVRLPDYERQVIGERVAAEVDARQAAQGQGDAVAWMSPGKERLEFSRPDTVYGSHTIPLYTHPAPAVSPAGVPDDAWRDLKRVVEFNEGICTTNEAASKALGFIGMWGRKLLAAAPSAPEGDRALLGMASCGKPLCSEGDHHPLCHANRPEGGGGEG